MFCVHSTFVLNMFSLHAVNLVCTIVHVGINVKERSIFSVKSLYGRGVLIYYYVHVLSDRCDVLFK